MQLLNEYGELQHENFSQRVKEQKAHLANPLGISFHQAKKVRRLLSGRLNTTHLTFTSIPQHYQTQKSLQLQTQHQNRQLHEDNNIEQQLRLLKGKLNISQYLCFSLICKLSQPQYELLVTFSVNLERASFVLQSKVMRNYRLLRIDSKSLVRFMAKYFISYNGKLKQGSFFVNPISSQISYLIHSHWTHQSVSSLIRNPQKFLNYIISQVELITARWNQCLDTILYLINKRQFDQIPTPSKKLKYVKMKLKRLSQLIIHSHVDAAFFIQTKPINIPRFKKIEQEERNHRLYQLKSQLVMMERRAKPLVNIMPILATTLVGRRRLVEATFRFPQWQLNQKKQFAMNLACHEYGGKFTIYSQIEIINIDSQLCIFQSIFSRIYRIDALFRRQSQPTPTKALLIRKRTQSKRYQNQISVLKLLKNQRCLFFPRYYFCQQEEYKEDIFVEFIPESSIDRYLMAKSLFIGNETKLFFLFQVVIALRFLRDNGIVHIDLKPENVLVKIVGDAKQNVHYLIKLIDFGESYSPKIDALASNVGRGFTIPYAPPQLLAKGQRFDQKTDVYSFGVIMLKIMFYHFPAEIMKLKKIEFIEQQYLKFYSFPCEKMEFYGTTEFVSLMYLLSLKCIQPDPSDRPTLDWLCIILKDLIITYEELNK